MQYVSRCLFPLLVLAFPEAVLAQWGAGQYGLEPRENYSDFSR